MFALIRFAIIAGVAFQSGGSWMLIAIGTSTAIALTSRHGLEGTSASPVSMARRVSA
jgi:hypothetical protein